MAQVATVRERSVLPGGEAARTYAVWAGWSGAAFFAVYPATNWLASQRSSTSELYLAAELGVPFVPQFIWPYLSMYALFLAPLFLVPAARLPSLGKQLIAGTFVSGLAFTLLPAKLGFQRTLPADPAYAAIYERMFGIDLPHNLVPSLHLVFSATIALACADAANAWVRAAVYAWLAAITLSTVLVHQHHVIDVLTAFLLVYLLRRKYKVSHA